MSRASVSTLRLCHMKRNSRGSQPRLLWLSLVAGENHREEITQPLWHVMKIREKCNQTPLKRAARREEEQSHMRQRKQGCGPEGIAPAAAALACAEEEILSRRVKAQAVAILFYGAEKKKSGVTR